jgi:hypothetical protein
VSVHLVKLCVGVGSIDELKAWQAGRLKDLKRRGRKPELMHVTRQTPRRAGELVDGGSLYWVIKGYIAARHRILALRAVTRDGAPACGIVYDPALVVTLPRFRSPFQGWRYLNPEDAPPDARASRGGDLPEALKVELAKLGLL